MVYERIDLVGRVFGELEVISYSHTSLNTAYWNCKCSCGNTTILAGKNLKARAMTGNPQGCGCKKRKYPKMDRGEFNTYTRWVSEKLYKFKLTEEDIRGLMDSQLGCCAVCGKSLINPVFNGHDLHIDHNHTTGEVRGLLCHNCNASLGFALDNKEVLIKLKRYIDGR